MVDFAQTIAPSNVGLRSLAPTYTQPDLAAGADLAETAIAIVPQDMKIQRIRIVPRGVSAGVDSGNTSVWTVRAGVAGTTIGVLTRTTDFAANTAYELTLTAAAQPVAAGTILTLQVTNGATADTDVTMVFVEGNSFGPSPIS